MEPLNFMFVDEEFLKLMEIPMLKGRNFSKDIKTDIPGSLIINEAAAKFLNWPDPIDKRISNGLMTKTENGQQVQLEGKVIGLIKDFNWWAR